MTKFVRLERRADIATIVIDNPPVNALGAQVRLGIAACLDEALKDNAVRAIIIAAEGRTFPAGADIAEFGQAPVSPILPELCDLIEASEKPVVAALHGTALGGGLELAMAAHFRIADAHAQVGLPEVKLGILPGAGGTQRLPRLIGAEPALDMILSGEPIGAQEALESGVIDQIATADLREDASAYAATLTKPRRTSHRRDAMRDGRAYMAKIEEYRREVKATFGAALAPSKIVDCVEAALLLPFPAGLALERDAFEACVTSRASVGLRHAFFAERRAAKFPELKLAEPRDVNQVAIVGGGLMGSGIAIACFNKGLDVTLVEQDEAAVTAVLERIGNHYQRAVAKGWMDESTAASALNHLTLTTKTEKLAEADLIIEAISEDMEAKTTLLHEIGQIAKPDAVIGSNTSYLDINKLAQVTGRSRDFVGIHFFAPADRMSLVEVIVGDETASQTTVTAHRFAKMLGKTPVRSGVCDGFIANRLLSKMRAAADAMVLAGAMPAQIDAAMRAFGFPQGPYQVLDRAGLDISWARRKALGLVNPIADGLCAAGDLGRKARRGYYLYEADGRQGMPNPDALALIEGTRAHQNIPQRRYRDRAIRDRVLLSLVNEGANILEEGIASRPSDIDTIMVHGFGYPRARGGPMLDADLTTLHTVAQRITRLAGEDPDFWKLSPFLERMAAERKKFSDLN